MFNSSAICSGILCFLVGLLTLSLLSKLFPLIPISLWLPAGGGLDFPPSVAHVLLRQSLRQQSFIMSLYLKRIRLLRMPWNQKLNWPENSKKMRRSNIKWVVLSLIWVAPEPGIPNFTGLSNSIGTQTMVPKEQNFRQLKKRMETLEEQNTQLILMVSWIAKCHSNSFQLPATGCQWVESSSAAGNMADATP